MRFLILSDMFSLESWLVEDQAPKIMPAVYEFYQYLGNHPEHRFHAIIIHSKQDKTITFPNGSSIQLHHSSMPNHYLRKLKSLFLQGKYGQDWIDQNKVDLVYGMSIYSLAARSLGRKNKILSVGRLFGSLLYDVVKEKRWFKLYTRYILQYLEARKACDLTICTEDGTEFDKAVDIIGAKHDLHTLYNGISESMRSTLKTIPAVKKISRDGKVRILYSGRLTNWKRQELAIETMDILVRQYSISNIHMTILGKGENKRKLKREIQRKKLDLYVEIQAPVEHSMIPDLLSEHDIFLSMYDASNLSNSIWEAALAGRLICTRDTGKTLKVFREGQNAVIANDASLMAAKIHQKIGQNVSALAENGRKTINKLIPSWSARFEAELAIIEKKIKE